MLSRSRPPTYYLCQAWSVCLDAVIAATLNRIVLLSMRIEILPGIKFAQNKDEIWIDGRKEYTFEKHPLAERREMCIQDTNHQPCVLFEREKIHRPVYLIHILGYEEAFYFQPDPAERFGYLCENRVRRYKLYEHQRQRWSISRDGRQVAMLDNERFYRWDKSPTHILADDDEQTLPLIGMAIIARNVNAPSSEPFEWSMHAIQWGRIWPRGKRYDESWSPKKI